MGGCFGKPDPALARRGHDVTPLKEKAPPVIWIIGGPGSGKATQVSKILAAFGFTHICSRDLIQSDIASESERGLKLKELVDTEKPIPKEPVLDLIIEKMLATVDNSKGYLMDGFPRDRGQASLFEKEVYPCTMVIYLECSPDTMKARLLERGRPEDTDDNIGKRIKIFKSTSLGVAKGYKKKCKTTSAEVEPDEVFENVKSAVEVSLS